MPINAKKSFDQFVSNRRGLEESESIPPFQCQGHGLSADDVRVARVNGKSGFDVHFATQSENGPKVRSIHPEGTEAPPNVSHIMSLDDATREQLGRGGVRWANGGG